MGVIDGAVRKASRTVGRAAAATTAAAGAVGGAAVNGAVGAVTGAAAGVQKGINSGSHSVPAAALALGALGVTGLVEWPILLAVGGGALVLRQLNRQRDTGAPAKAQPAKKSAPAKKSTGSTTQAKKAPARSRGAQSRARR
ncbi:hypothetical protein [Mycobacterium branderi]|uniref:Transmembrane protein n=1 Tax=Mycobacterium branderi TaxID=43348 RepID=A0A7I7VZV4_9MYCO|nr:hypothetical protein [Mycobacterium branderi]MCV7236140.1 hypothetical protein [Mycobacterium branderi]ORA32069.1 hypothetical protein BST20_25675 [Mycobacterium branderi]BBZ10829.1 hypothetical protein MBRA_10240 [Mycobacterium branderi]